MTADLLRQLDTYGDQIEDSIDHVKIDDLLASIDETTDPAPSPAKPRRSAWRSPFVKTAAGLAGLVVVVGFVTTTVGSAGSDTAASDTTASPQTTAAAATTTIARNSSRGGVAFDSSLALVAEGGVDQFRQPINPAIVQTPTTTAAPAATATTPPGATPTAAQGRDIVFVADVVVAVTDSSTSADQVRQIVATFGGFVSRSSTTTRDGGESVLTLRVLPDTFRRVLDRVGELGVVRSERVTSDDVTEAVVDLESQIATTVISLDRLRGLLAEAKQLQTITKLESELLRRETDLERLRGQLRTIEAQVALATITVTLTESIGNPNIDLAVTRYVGDDGGAACPEGGGPRITTGDNVTVCLTITNTGDVPLTSVRIDGDGVPVFPGGLITLRGELDRLAPGDIIALTGVAPATSRLSTDFTASGVPLNDLDEPVTERTVERSRRVGWDPAALPEPEIPDEPPTIGSALADGWDVFAAAMLGTLRGIAFVLPFLVLTIVIGLGLWWRRRIYWRAPERVVEPGIAEATTTPSE